MSKKSKKQTPIELPKQKRRSVNARLANGRHAGPMKDRRTPRGGSKREEHQILTKAYVCDGECDTRVYVSRIMPCEWSEDPPYCVNCGSKLEIDEDE
jgi:hypothetical protein